MLHVTEYLTGPAFGGQVRIARAVADLTLDKQILKEAAQENF